MEITCDSAADNGPQYTSPAYFARTSRVCHPLSFADLAAGRLPPSRARDAMEVDDSGPEWDMIVCSFALHLLTEASELAALLDELSRRATWLVVVAPHREPEVSGGVVERFLETEGGEDESRGVCDVGSVWLELG